MSAGEHSFRGVLIAIALRSFYINIGRKVSMKQVKNVCTSATFKVFYKDIKIGVVSLKFVANNLLYIYSLIVYGSRIHIIRF